MAKEGFPKPTGKQVLFYVAAGVAAVAFGIGELGNSSHKNKPVPVTPLPSSAGTLPRGFTDCPSPFNVGAEYDCPDGLAVDNVTPSSINVVGGPTVELNKHYKATVVYEGKRFSVYANAGKKLVRVRPLG